MQKMIVWNGLEDDTEEHCAVNYHEDGSVMIHSEIEGWVNNKAVYLEYWVNTDAGWNVKSFEVSARIADTEYFYGLKRDGNGNWINGMGEAQPQFEGCSYIDISLTPFTNTLPINGLLLNNNESRDIDVVYIDVMEHEMHRDRQNYKRIAGFLFRFENDGGNFIAHIETNEDGYVTRYPNLFEMIRVNKL